MEVKGYSLAILGDEGVGKTSFLNRFISNTFNESEAPTIGGEYFQKIFDHNSQTIKIDIFGSSGKSKSQKLVKYLYKDARSILLMFNLNKKSTFNNLKYYLENIRINSVEDPIVYIAGNFADEDASNHQITKEILKDFEKKNNLKCFEISCKTGLGVNELMEELTKDILITEKFYSSMVDKDISDVSYKDYDDKEIERISKTMKTYYKDTKEKKCNYIRCNVCDKLLIVKFRNTYNEVSFICNTCKTENNVDIRKIDEYMENLEEKIICFECGKQKEERVKLEYCNKCRQYICPNCKKNLVKQFKMSGNELHRLYPYYLIDIICFEHYNKVIGYCKQCEKNICIKCFEYHKTHENIFFQEFFEQLRDRNREAMNEEIKIMHTFKKNFEDCIMSIRKEVNHFILMKDKEIKLKEQLLSQLNNIQWNYQLIETIKNFKYLKKPKYEYNSSWYQKLTDIFEVIGQPIQIKNINMSKGHNSYISPHIIKLRGDSQTDDNDHNITQNSSYIDSSKEITDFCSMNDNKYLGVSFNTGILELYEDVVNNKEPIHSFKFFNKNEGIKSIYKSTRNVNNFFFCGKERIKNVEFYNNYETYKTLIEITDKKRFFNLTLEQDNCIITSDINNKIIIYDKESNKIGDITDLIDSSGNKDIYSIKEISNNLIIITFNKSSENSRGTSVERSSYFFNESEDTNIDTSVISLSRNSVKDQVELGTKIIELNDNNSYKVKREHILSDKQEFIGFLSEKLILIRDDNYNSVILFDTNVFKNVQRFYFEVGEKPTYCSALNRRPNLIDFVLVTDDMKMLQNIYDEEHKSVTQISGLKIQAENEEINNEISKVGKIIHIPFKGIVKYIGDNNFVVINF